MTAGARRRCVAAVAVALLVAGCGQAASRRPQLAAYLNHVQRLQTQMQAPLGAVGSAGSTLASGQGTAPTLLGNLAIASSTESLARAIRRQQALRAELAGMAEPPEAARLRGLLLVLADRQLALMHELARLITFLPRFNGLLHSLVPATRRLQVTLSAGGTYSAATVGAVFAQKAVGLRAFQKTVDRIAAKLARLDPPAVSRPGWRTQLASLRRMGLSAGRLAALLASGTATGIAAQLLAFDRAASLNRTVAAQEAQIAAIKAYDREVAGLPTLVRAVERERYRLNTTVR